MTWNNYLAGLCYCWLFITGGIVTSDAAAAVGCEEMPVHYQCMEKDPYLVKEYNVGSHVSLSVFTPGGNIQLIPSEDADKIRMELYVNHGFYGWLFGNNLENYRITNFKRHNEIIASVEKKRKERTSFWDTQTTFSYKIYVPTSISTSLKTLGGSIAIDQLTGRHLLKSSGGNINISHANGLIKAYTSGGNIHISNSGGALYAQTDGGNISVDRSMGELRLKTKGGTISSSDISGSMIAQVDGGDIKAHFKKVSKGISLKTAAGNITLIIPDSTGYNLLANGTQVEFSRSLPFRGKHTNRMVEGTLYGGGVPVHLATNSGTVTFQVIE